MRMYEFDNQVMDAIVESAYYKALNDRVSLNILYNLDNYIIIDYLGREEGPERIIPYLFDNDEFRRLPNPTYVEWHINVEEEY